MIGLIEFNQQPQKKRNWLKTAAIGAGAIGAVAGGGMLLKKKLAKGVPAPKQPKPDIDTSSYDAAVKRLNDNVDGLGSPKPPAPPKSRATPAANTPRKNPLSAETIAKRQANTAKIKPKKAYIDEAAEGAEWGGQKSGMLRRSIAKAKYGYKGKPVEKFNQHLQNINFSFARNALAPKPKQQHRYSQGAVFAGIAGLTQARNAAKGVRLDELNMGKGKSRAVFAATSAASLGGAAYLQRRRDRYLRKQGYAVKGIKPVVKRA